MWEFALNHCSKNCTLTTYFFLCYLTNCRTNYFLEKSWYVQYKWKRFCILWCHWQVNFALRNYCWMFIAWNAYKVTFYAYFKVSMLQMSYFCHNFDIISRAFTIKWLTLRIFWNACFYMIYWFVETNILSTRIVWTV